MHTGVQSLHSLGSNRQTKCSYKLCYSVTLANLCITNCYENRAHFSPPPTPHFISLKRCEGIWMKELQSNMHNYELNQFKMFSNAQI